MVRQASPLARPLLRVWLGLVDVDLEQFFLRLRGAMERVPRHRVEPLSQVFVFLLQLAVESAQTRQAICDLRGINLIRFWRVGDLEIQTVVSLRIAGGGARPEVLHLEPVDQVDIEVQVSVRLRFRDPVDE